MKRTFFEIVIVLSLFVWLLWPTVQSVRGSGRRMTCFNNASQLGLALLSYEAEHGHFPPPYTVDENGKPLHSWRVLVLPYMEEKHLYDQIRLNEPWDSPHNSQFHSVSVSAFCCPSDENNHGKERPYTSYDVVVGENTAFPPFDSESMSQPIVSVDDIAQSAAGTSQTVLLVERQCPPEKPIHWMNPTPLKIGDLESGIAFRHNGGSVIVTADRLSKPFSHEAGIDLLRKMAEWKNRTEEDGLALNAALDEVNRKREERQAWINARNAALRIGIVPVIALCVYVIVLVYRRIFSQQVPPPEDDWT